MGQAPPWQTSLLLPLSCTGRGIVPFSQLGFREEVACQIREQSGGRAGEDQRLSLQMLPPGKGELETTSKSLRPGASRAGPVATRKGLILVLCHHTSHASPTSGLGTISASIRGVP